MSLNPSVSVFPAVGRIAEQRLIDLDEVAQMTDKMLHWAEAGDWEALVNAQTRRDDVLRACFAAPVLDADTVVVSEKIRELLRLNERLVKKVTEAKQRLSRATHQSRKEVLAAKSYLGASS